MTRVYLDMAADVFTAAQVDLLRKARALGDELMVGVHSDDDCEWYHRRPATPLDERARIVAACPHVDRVCAGAPVFLAETWLRAQGIDLVAHSDALPSRARDYWYGTPIRLGIFRSIPSGEEVSDVDLEGRLLHRRAAIPGPISPRGHARRLLRRWLPPADRALQRAVFVRGLQRFADALRGTPLDGRYWVVAGLLLGWAREGRPLDSDLEDADFAYLDEDHDRFLASIPALAAAGFAPRHRFSSAGGRYVEHRLRRRGVHFEVFRMRRVGDCWRYSMFESGDEPSELVAEVPAQPHVPFRVAGREWLKVADHDLALRTIYGNWRTDRRDWSYTFDRAIVERIPMAQLPYAWDWPGAVALGPGERPT